MNGEKCLASQLAAPVTRNGGAILIQQLRNHGVKRLFMVPGESYLPCIDALYDHQDAIQAVVCRQESGAGYMAEAHGKLTGEPGICFVTRGPGATNASIAVHTAFHDSTPMILFVGQVGGDFMGREAFQEVDYRSMFSGMAKWVAQIDRTDRIPEFIARAFSVATSGRPGPVVLALPEDTLWGEAAVADVPHYRKSSSTPSVMHMQAMAALLENARNPFLLIGGSGWTSHAMTLMAGFAERYALPVGLAWRRLECFDHSHPNYVGHVGWGMSEQLRNRIKNADVLIAVGTRISEAVCEGYTVVQSPMPTQQLVHVYPDPDELGRVFQAAVPITADVASFAEAVKDMAPAGLPGWAAQTQAARAELAQRREPASFPGDLSLDQAACYVRDHVPEDTCITVGAGNYAGFPHRYYRYRGLGTSLAPTAGSMGYGLPAAIAAKLEYPARTVICYAGDGCFQMNLQELGVAMQYRLGIVILVFNNGIWGTIRMHQEREFPGRNHALNFENPEFSELVRAYRGHGEVVSTNAEFGPAFERALAFANANQLPALVELRYDADGISPGVTLSEVRDAALARISAAKPS